MRRPRCFWIGLALAVACGGLAGRACGDGGAVRLSERHGDMRVTVFTSPDPVRVGPVEIGVLVQNAATGAVVPDARVRVTASGSRWIEQAATTGGLLRVAVLDIPAAGQWDVQVGIASGIGRAECRVALDVGEPLPRWAALAPWIGWPALAVLGFALHEWRSGRRRQGKYAAPA